MKYVYKFPLPIDDIVIVQLPKYAKPLYVNEQNGVPCLWCLVDPDNPLELRRFRFAGTGHPIKDEDCGKYVGSFYMKSGALVFHIFDIDGDKNGLL